jgi:hypothetical protein
MAQHAVNLWLGDHFDTALCLLRNYALSGPPPACEYSRRFLGPRAVTFSNTAHLEMDFNRTGPIEFLNLVAFSSTRKQNVQIKAEVWLIGPLG